MSAVDRLGPYNEALFTKKFKQFWTTGQNWSTLFWPASQNRLRQPGFNMQSLNEWFGVLWELLLDCEEELCYNLIYKTRPECRDGQVELIEGNLSAEDAVYYARVLVELGRDFCAQEVLRAAAFGGIVPAKVTSPYIASHGINAGVLATA